MYDDSELIYFKIFHGLQKKKWVSKRNERVWFSQISLGSGNLRNDISRYVTHKNVCPIASAWYMFSITILWTWLDQKLNDSCSKAPQILRITSVDFGHKISKLFSILIRFMTFYVLLSYMGWYWGYWASKNVGIFWCVSAAPGVRFSGRKCS